MLLLLIQCVSVIFFMLNVEVSMVSISVAGGLQDIIWMGFHEEMCYCHRCDTLIKNPSTIM